MLTDEQEREDAAINALVEARDAVDRALAAVPARGAADALAKAERLAEMLREGCLEPVHLALAEAVEADLRRLAAN